MIEAWRGPIHGLVTQRQTKELEDVMRPDVFLEAVGAHQTVSQAKAILAVRGKRIEDFRAVFVGVRDPYDMAVSRYFFMRRTYQWNQDRPTFRMAHELPFEDFWSTYRANLGDAFLTIDGAVLENQRFIRFETLQEDLDAISAAEHTIEGHRLSLTLKQGQRQFAAERGAVRPQPRVGAVVDVCFQSSREGFVSLWSHPADQGAPVRILPNEYIRAEDDELGVAVQPGVSRCFSDLAAGKRVSLRVNKPIGQAGHYLHFAESPEGQTDCSG